MKCLAVSKLWESWIQTQLFLIKGVHLKISSEKYRSFCLGFTALTHCALMTVVINLGNDLLTLLRQAISNVAQKYPKEYPYLWFHHNVFTNIHYSDVTMGAIASQIISLTVVYSTVYSGADQRKYRSSVSLAFVRGIYRWPVNPPHKWPVTRKMFPFDDVIMSVQYMGRSGGTVREISSTIILSNLCIRLSTKIILKHMFDQ